MGIRIYPVPLGFCQTYLIQDQGIILIDAGTPGREKAFSKALNRLSIRPEAVELMVLTHGHWDHVGSAKAIQEITGARIAMHQKERSWLERSKKVVPPGATLWGRIFGGIMKAFLPLVHIPPAPVEVVMGDAPLSLTPYGIPGRVFHTPGHSPGSVSVLLDTGQAFVGDLAMNKFPLRLSPGLPIFAEDKAAVRKSWYLLLDQGADTIYPAHGKPFSADVMKRALTL